MEDYKALEEVAQMASFRDEKLAGTVDLDSSGQKHGSIQHASSVRKGSGRGMADSELTPSTSEFTLSEDDSTGAASGGWWGGIGSDIRQMATSIRSTVPSAIGGIADFVHQSAMNVAAEIARLEQEENGEREESAALATSEDGDVEGTLPLPWEIRTEGPRGQSSSGYHCDHELMEKLFRLSKNDETFLQPFSSEIDAKGFPPDFHFELTEKYDELICRVLECDKHISSAQDSLVGSGRISEYIFWKNYFYNCEVYKHNLLRRKTPSCLSMGSAGRTRSLSGDSSLVPASDDEASAASSFVLTSPPASTLSVEDLVLIGRMRNSESI